MYQNKILELSQRRNNEPKDIWVLGDIMLDNYVYGDVQRVSPEAPIVVLDERTSEMIPGGAARVAIYLSSLGGRPSLFGWADPQTKHHILDFIPNTGSGLLENARFTKPLLKTRYIADNQQILRVDRDYDYIEFPLDSLPQKAPSAIIVSDYSKGTITTRLMEKLLTYNVPLVVDTKREDIAYFADYAKFNRHEASVLNVSRLVDNGVTVIITSSSSHTTCKNNELVQMKPPLVNCVDPTGAGDAFTAGFTLALAYGYDFRTCIYLGNLIGAHSVTEWAGRAIIDSTLEGIISQYVHEN